MTERDRIRKLCECTDMDGDKMIAMLKYCHSDTIFNLIVRRIKDMQAHKTNKTTMELEFIAFEKVRESTHKLSGNTRLSLGRIFNVDMDTDEAKEISDAMQAGYDISFSPIMKGE